MTLIKRRLAAAVIALGAVLVCASEGAAEPYRVWKVFGGVGWIGKENHTPTDVLVEEATRNSKVDFGLRPSAFSLKRYPPPSPSPSRGEGNY